MNASSRVRWWLLGIVAFIVMLAPLSSAQAAPPGWPSAPNAPYACNNPYPPPDCPSRYQRYPEPTAAIPGIVKASRGRCSAYDATSVICEGGPPPCIEGSADKTCLKAGVTENEQEDTLVGDFWVTAPPKPKQEVAVRMSVNSDYSMPGGSAVPLKAIPGKPSHEATQAKVMHFRGSYDITVVSLYFPKAGKWLRCTGGCTYTLTVAAGR
jgi:hypothetical protein